MICFRDSWSTHWSTAKNTQKPNNFFSCLPFFNPVKVQCYRITHVHNYYSIPSMTILWKILYLSFLEILNQILWGILFGSASRVNCDKLTVIEMVQDIESVSQRDWFIYHIYWVWELEISRYKYFWLVYSAGLKTRKELALKHFVMTSSSSSIFWLIIFNRNCLQEFCCDLISGKLVSKLVYITILLYYTIHVVSFRKTILI